MKRSKFSEESIAHAPPLQLVEIERRGVPATLVKQLARCLHLPTDRLLAMLGLPKGVSSGRKAKSDPLPLRLTGQGAYAVLAVASLLGMADAMVARSAAPEAEDFDVGRWLGEWLERPVPALGGQRPADLLDTPTGFENVSRVLAAAESGAYL